MSYEDSDSGFQLYLRQIAQYALLTPAQEVVLAAKIKKGNKAAKAEMIRANLRLVVKIARDYANLGLPLMDLISEGNIGLVKAVERFDPEGWQALHLWFLVDQTVDQARPCKSG